MIPESIVLNILIFQTEMARAGLTLLTVFLSKSPSLLASRTRVAVVGAGRSNPR